VYDIVLECKNVSHWFGPQHVLYDINLQVVRGEIVGLVGESGCGKSTLLRAILGTHTPQSGQILMNGQPVSEPGRDRGIVYQRYALFPFLTAIENVAFGLMFEQAPLPYRFFQFWKWWALRKKHLERAADKLRKVKLEDDKHFLYPAQLSGGQCQRVAIAQALIMEPEILLLDEPFGALDEATREEHQEMLLELYEENLLAKKAGHKPAYTIILVTHELNEAIYVSDRVVALSRDWQWQEETNCKEHPGATIVYDAASPASPRDPLNRYDQFLKQREEIRQVAFQPAKHPNRRDYLRFWKECEEGKGAGVMRKLDPSETYETLKI
jgi:NitT/TauT family transport system ATP-binding protein